MTTTLTKWNVWGEAHDGRGNLVTLYNNYVETRYFDIVQTGYEAFGANHWCTFYRDGTVKHEIHGERYREWFQQNPFNAVQDARHAFRHLLGAYFVAVTQVLRKLPPCLERYVWKF